MTQFVTNLNRFLRRNFYLFSKFIMWLIGLGSLTYLILNIFQGLNLPNEKYTATNLNEQNVGGAIEGTNISDMDISIEVIDTI